MVQHQKIRTTALMSVRTIGSRRERSRVGLTKPENEEIVWKILDYNKKQKDGQFIPNREKDALTLSLGNKEHKDALTLSLGNKEHGGRVRGISSKVNWKEGFVRDRARYKRHERFMQMIREEAEAIFSERVLGLCLDQIHQFDAVNDQPRSLAILTETDLSMVADPLDRISVPTPCLILIHVGKHGRVEVMGNALAFPSDMFYGTPIPPGYIWVQVVLIDPKHGEEPLVLISGDCSAMAGRGRGLMRSLTDLLGGRSPQAGESSQRTRRTGRRSRRSGAGSSTCDAAEGSGTASGGRTGRRSRHRRGSPLVEEEAEEEEDPGAEEHEHEQEQEQEEEEEDGADEEEEDLGIPAVWQRGPSRLPDRPIPLEHRPVLRLDGKR